jgi:hypothetical protein
LIRKDYSFDRLRGLHLARQEAFGDDWILLPHVLVSAVS